MLVQSMDVETSASNLDAVFGGESFEAHRYDTNDKYCDSRGLLSELYGDCIVIFHGECGSGKTRAIECLAGLPFRDLCKEGSTTSATLFENVRIGSYCLAIIDTPGFGVTNLDKQDAVICGMDTAVALSKSSTKPLKRLYYFMKFGRLNKILNYLKIMKYVYESAFQGLAIVVSFMDADMVDKTTVDKFRSAIQDFVSKEFQFIPKVFFTGFSLGNGCFIQLSNDLTQASRDPDLKLPCKLPLLDELCGRENLLQRFREMALTNESNEAKLRQKERNKADKALVLEGLGNFLSGAGAIFTGFTVLSKVPTVASELGKVAKIHTIVKVAGITANSATVLSLMGTTMGASSATLKLLNQFAKEKEAQGDDEKGDENSEAEKQNNFTETYEKEIKELEEFSNQIRSFVS